MRSLSVGQENLQFPRYVKIFSNKKGWVSFSWLKITCFEKSQEKGKVLMSGKTLSYNSFPQEVLPTLLQ
jgi:hypothetical protein